MANQDQLARLRSTVTAAVFLTALLWVAVVSPVEAGVDISRPPGDGGPTEVRTSIYLIDIDEIDGANQNFTANVVYLCQWDDPRLAHDGHGPVSHPLDGVWHPRLQFVNQQKTWATFPEVVSVSPAGEVTYRQRVWGGFSQPLRLHDFPFDRQHFAIHLVSAGYSPQEVVFVDTAEGSGIAEELSLADWAIESWSSAIKPYSVRRGGRSVAGFEFRFEARRHGGYFVTKVILPLIFIVAMSWVVFWIDPVDAGSQISVSVTAMLTLIAYRFAVGALLPKVSYLTRMDYFILASTVLVFLSLVEGVVTSRLAAGGRLEIARRLDHHARWVFPAVFLAIGVKSFI